jgi:MoaA/NifB/PqqE/SkfB family radical SAM enzyme
MKIYNILINVTEVCHVGCRHCGYIGSRRDREMTADEIDSWVRQVCAFGVNKVIFTGGEAFERFEMLSRGVKSAHESGVASAVFTSAFWAKTPERAREVLREVASLRQLYISTDKYHQERVPIAHVYHAIDAALELGIPKITMTITYANRRDLDEVSSWYARYGSKVEISSQLLIPNKGMRRDETQYVPQFDLAPENYGSRCFLATPLINPNGDVYACHIGKVSSHRGIGKSPYALGNLREASFEEIMGDARRRSDYRYLVAHGPRGVAESMQASPEAAKSLPRCKFTSGCDMCMSVMLTPPAAEAFRKHAEQAKESTEIRLALMAATEPAPERLDLQAAGAA